MNCIKCGVEIKEPQVFCDRCLEEMEQYPVKPNVTVTLPPQVKASVSKKKNRRQRYTKPEDQIRQLRSTLRILLAALAVVFIAFVMVAVMMLNLLNEKEDETPSGQEYNSAATEENP